MIDTFNLSDDSLTKEVFLPNGTTSWQIWTKPANAKFVNMLLIGGGGGGGAGASSNAGAGGGGGGGCSAISRAFFHASFLPDRLYIQVGNGGLGGIAPPLTAAATAGGISYVSIQPNTTANNVIVASGTAGAGAGGAGGNGAAAGTAGTAGSIYTASLLTPLGSFQGIAGLAGTGGGPGNTTMTTITIGATVYLIPITPGLGGGGVSAAGTPDTTGSIIGASFFPTISGGTASPTFGSNAGNGYCGLRPNSNSSSRLTFLSTGGAGGGPGGYGGIVGSGGSGGFAGIGSGGGGGGASFFGSTNGGRGGNGGDGIVIINCY